MSPRPRGAGAPRPAAPRRRRALWRRLATHNLGPHGPAPRTGSRLQHCQYMYLLSASRLHARTGTQPLRTLNSRLNWFRAFAPAAPARRRLGRLLISQGFLTVWSRAPRPAAPDQIPCGFEYCAAGVASGRVCSARPPRRRHCDRMLPCASSPRPPRSLWIGPLGCVERAEDMFRGAGAPRMAPCLCLQVLDCPLQCAPTWPCRTRPLRCARPCAPAACNNVRARCRPSAGAARRSDA